MVKKWNKRFIFISIFVLLAIACILYGIRVMWLGYGTSFFLIWMILAAALLFIAFAIYKQLWKWFPKWLRRTIVIVVSICIALFVFVEGCILSAVNAQGEKDLDYVIVLGAMVKEDGPSSILAARLNAAVRYLEENERTKVIVSGGQGENEPWSEAEGMKRYLVEKGIEEERIILEPDSFNTIQNISNSKKLMGDENASVGIVTSNFHVFRACAIARKQGLKNVSGIAGYVVPFYMPQNMFREFFGIVKDTLAGNM